jgi:hypothetical protein
MAKRTPAQNRRYYENRVKKAKDEGFRGYYEKRTVQEQLRDTDPLDRGYLIDHLRESYPDAPIFTEDWRDSAPQRFNALEYLESKGYTEDQLQALADSDTFWEEVRPLLEKESA